jgi:RNA polymerase I-specific transcription initiation factor RRN3
MNSWRLNEIIHCPLNPLKYCSNEIKNKFAQITKEKQIAFCEIIIDANKRQSLPISDELKRNGCLVVPSSSSSSSKSSKSLIEGENDQAISTNNPLDSFFPFDPYLLKKSKRFIEKFYQTFKNTYNSNIEDTSDDESSDTNSINDKNDNESTDDDDQDEDQDDFY